MSDRKQPVNMHDQNPDRITKQYAHHSTGIGGGLVGAAIGGLLGRRVGGAFGKPFIKGSQYHIREIAIIMFYSFLLLLICRI